MDIHRCRFVPFPPSTINALAFSHSHVTKKQKTASPRLAVGRANGDIEIWNPLKGSWLQETIIRGGKDRSIDGLVWTQDPNEEVEGKTLVGKSRLFSIGYTTTVTEWDVAKGMPLRSASGNHGEIWCIAAQPALPPSSNAIDGNINAQSQAQHLIAGCTDGALVLYSTEDDDLQLQKILVRPSAKKAKIISVAFQNRNIVVAGCTDSVLRIFDIRSGSLLRNMSTGVGPRGGPKEVIIWSVKVLQNGTIVSGDSTGELKIWDGKTYSLRQRIQSHRQDILSLAVNHDGSAIFSGGMDRRTVTYKLTGKGKTRWTEVGHKRFHIHDVKTMASYEAPGISVVVSGGPDASPIVLPLARTGYELQRSLPFLPQGSSIVSAPRARLMMSWWDREVRIWRIFPSFQVQDEDPTKTRKLVTRILIKGEANITSATLSLDGSLLAVSTITDLKIFQLEPKEDGTLHTSKVALTASLDFGARLVQFSPDTKWLCILRPNSHVVLVRILQSSSASSSSSITLHPKLTRVDRLDRQIPKLVTIGGLGTYDRTVTQIAFSSDSRILAVSDLSGYIDTFVLSGNEDTTQDTLDEDLDAMSPTSDADSASDSGSEEEHVKLILGQHWTRNPLASSIPKLPTPPVSLSFRPSIGPSPSVANGITPPATRNTPHPVSHELPNGEDRLLVVTATSEVYEFSVFQGALSNWSRRNPPSIFPEEFTRTLETVRGVVWDVTESHERVWLWSIGWLWRFDLKRDFPQKEDGAPDASTSPTKKRKRGAKEYLSGAGGETKKEELGLGMGQAIQRTIFNQDLAGNEVEEKLDLLGDNVDVMEVDDDQVDSVVTLQQLQKAAEESQKEESTSDAPKGRMDWHTFKYRPILGVVPISEANREGELEVVIVERPIWDVDLPPRFYGEQEWRDKETDLK